MITVDNSEYFAYPIDYQKQAVVDELDNYQKFQFHGLKRLFGLDEVYRQVQELELGHDLAEIYDIQILGARENYGLLHAKLSNAQEVIIAFSLNDLTFQALDSHLIPKVQNGGDNSVFIKAK